MSTELEQRLSRLAPEVDIEAARAAMRSRQRQSRVRRALVGGALALMTGAAVIAAIAWNSPDPGQSVAVVGNDPLTSTSLPTRTSTVVSSGIELSVTAPEAVTAGSRLWFDVAVKNVSEADVLWQAGGCRVPVTAMFAPASRATVERPVEDHARWDGDVDGLGAWLGDHNTNVGIARAQSENATAIRVVGCTADSRMEAIAPGGTVPYRASVEVRLPPGPLPDDGAFLLMVDFQSVAVRAPIKVLDDPARGAADDAIEAFARDDRLPAWITSTAIPNRPDLVQSFDTELSWWRGAWELWVTAYWEGTSLRMRYDPAASEVVDVRAVRGGSADDEPERIPYPGDPVDEVIPPGPS